MSVGARVRRIRFVVKAGYDLVAWFGAVAAATALRYSDVRGASWRDAALVAGALAAVYLVVGLAVRLHQGRARNGSMEDMLLVGMVASFSGMVVFAWNAVHIGVPRTVPAGATVVFIVVAGLGRASWRAFTERTPAPAAGSTEPTRTLIAGAGDAGHDLVISMLRDATGEWHPVGFLDDDRAKRHLRIRGVPVRGDTSAIERVAEKSGAKALIIAIPSASATTVRRIADAGRSAGLEVKVLPSTSELLRDDVGITDIRDINLADVLGRNQVDTDVASIAGYLFGKRVLVTGAGGSIGSELCRQIARFGPCELIMLDRDESALHAVQLSLTGRALLDDSAVVLCDIRDSPALTQIFMRRRPEVVFHAAALKHLPMLEQYPAEAIKTNVVGTRNVLEAATRAGVERLVNISTDKAANPTSVLGYSKRLAERMTSTFARPGTSSFLSVRFGNVLGSRGSVLTTFAQQISAGGPVTITHPDVTRYFMTIGEACQLVIQAGVIGRAGETLVLDMGTPVKIVDVAQHLIQLDGHAISLEFTGLRRGEKLHEDLFDDAEPRDVRPWHPLVFHVPMQPIDLSRIDDLPTRGSSTAMVGALACACVEGDDASRADVPDWAELSDIDDALRDTLSQYDD